jgi:hypothetical protein
MVTGFEVAITHLLARMLVLDRSGSGEAGHEIISIK